MTVRRSPVRTLLNFRHRIAGSQRQKEQGIFLLAEFLSHPQPNDRRPISLALLLVALAFCGCREQVDEKRLSLPTPVLPDLSQTYYEVAEVLRDRFKIVQSYPESAGAWGRYGMTLDAHEFRDECIPCYLAARMLDPADIRWAYYLAIQLKSSDPERAAEILRMPFRGDTDSLPLLLLRTSILQELGRKTEAEETLQLASGADPTNPAVIIQVARSLMDKNQPREARTLLLSVPPASGEGVVSGKPVVSLAEQFREAAVLCGRAETALGNPESGARFLQSATLLPGVQTAVKDRFLEELAAVRRDPLWVGQQAAVNARDGSYVARSQLIGLVKRYPDVVPNRIHLAMLLSSEGQYEQAEKLLLEGLRSDAEDSRLLAGLASLSIEQQKWEVAESHLNQLLQLDPGNGAAIGDLAFILEQQRRTQEAIEAYRKAIELMPADEELSERLEKLQKASEVRN